MVAHGCYNACDEVSRHWELDIEGRHSQQVKC